MLPSVRDRMLALALLLSVIAVVYLLLVHPWFTAPLLAINQDVAELQERGQRVDAQLAQKPQVAAALRDARAELASRPGFLTDATTEAAAASLGTRVQDVVTAASPEHRACTISNRTPMPDNRAGTAYPRVAMQVRLRCGVDEMARVLHALETGTPRLFVENLNLLAQRYQQSPDETGTGLDVSFELVGYLQPDVQTAVAAAAVATGAGSANPAAGPQDGAAVAAPAADAAADTPPPAVVESAADSAPAAAAQDPVEPADVP